MSENIAFRNLDKNLIYKIISNYDELLDNLNIQVDFYKKEHEEVRAEIFRVLKENEELGTELKLISSQTEVSQSISAENYKKLTNCIIKNLHRKIHNLTDEKKSLEQCWEASQQTIAKLDKSLKELHTHYPRQQSLNEIKAEYNATLAILETKVKEAKEKLCEQQAVNKKLFELKTRQRKEFDALKENFMKLENEQKLSIDKLQETETLLVKTKEELANMMKRKSEIEHYLIKTNAANCEQTVKQTEALLKVQESLNVAETALKEKNEAIARELEMREQCDFLTSNLNFVMDDAAKKLDDEVTGVRAECNLKIKTICATVDELKIKLAAETERASVAEKTIVLLENELRNVSAANSRLDSDLHLASQTIIDMELKLEAFENLMESEEATNKLCEERAKELQTILKQNRMLKEKWKLTVEDIANKLQCEIKQLQKENCKLKNENANLKLSRKNIGVK